MIDTEVIIQVKRFTYLLTESNGHPSNALGNVFLRFRSGIGETGGWGLGEGQHGSNYVFLTTQYYTI